MSTHKSEFNWDAYLATAKYEQVRRTSPLLSSMRHPTVFSPDRSLLYLSSQDIDVKTNSVSDLRMALNAICNSYESAQQSDHRALWLIRTDCYAVCSLLQESGECADDYDDPEQFLSGGTLYLAEVSKKE